MRTERDYALDYSKAKVSIDSAMEHSETPGLSSECLVDTMQESPMKKKFMTGIPFALLMIACFCIAGFLHFWVHRDMPIVRGSLVYARIVDHMLCSFDKFQANHDAYNKPLGFAYLSYPFVKMWGSNIGLEVVSLIATSFWIMSLIPFYLRLSKAFKLKTNYLTLFLCIACINPLVYYQFISAYSDMLFATGFLWSIYFLDRIFSRDIKWFDGILFSFTCIFSIWVKHHGFILIPIVIILSACRYNVLIWAWGNRRKEVMIAISCLLFVAIFLSFAMIGYDFKLFNIRTDVTNYTSDKGIDKLTILHKNFKYMFVYLLLSFGILSAFVFYFRNWKSAKAWYLTLICFICSILFYRGTKDNIRYYIAIAPFFAIIIACALSRLHQSLRYVLVALFLISNTYTLLYYNCLSFNSYASNFTLLRNIDNLKLVNEQKNARETIDEINYLHRQKSYNSFFFISMYYEDGAWYTWENDGFFDDGIKIIYSRKWSHSLLSKCDNDRAIIYDRKSLNWKKHKNIFKNHGKDVYTINLEVHSKSAGHS